MEVNKEKISKFIEKRCKKSGINLPDSFVVLSGNNEIIKTIADSYKAQMINSSPIFTEYICNSDEGCVVLKSVDKGSIQDDRMRIYISGNDKSTSARFNLHDVVGGDCYEW